MCRQIFTAKVISGVGTKEELEELQKLVDGHRVSREQVGVEEFEAFEG